MYEWCGDWYDEDYYASSPTKDPAGTASGSRRVLCGGSWYYSADYCRSAYRGRYGPKDRFDMCGFRVASLMMAIDVEAHAQEDKVVEFPDANLQAAIRRAISKPTGDMRVGDLTRLTILDADDETDGDDSDDI